MKTIPKHPYLQNIISEYYREHDQIGDEKYVEWLRHFGFMVPLTNFHLLEFPDDFPDSELAMFIMRWS